MIPSPFPALALAGLLALGACASAGAPAPSSGEAGPRGSFAQDRAAILAMAGKFDVSFDFAETVAFVEGYAPGAPTHSEAHEVVRVIADEGDFISLQHILVVGGRTPRALKHWRQDWAYEPETMLDFVGNNSWVVRRLSPAERAGKWTQTVYQVDDAPRYAGIAAWSHERGVAQWASAPSLRPLPRRDATRRDDYDAILAVNRHALTPGGWVHEQDNSKLVLGPGAHVLVRETGLNRYVASDGFDASVADAYWAATRDYWAAVRAEWAGYAERTEAFGLTVRGEPEPVYGPLLALSDKVAAGTLAVDAAAAEARAVLARFVTTAPERLALAGSGD
ncbi:MAG: hypothetical protein HXY25_07335 [Alphaproteobacteria bacterium]|nr:hypothetical protein [Alphaproteobacteria bacterium]